MPENGKVKWIHYLVSVVVIILITVISTIGNNVIANDKCSRERDDEIDNKLSKVYVEQQKINERVSVDIASIKVSQSYILEGIKEIKRAVQ